MTAGDFDLSPVFAALSSAKSESLSDWSAEEIFAFCEQFVGIRIVYKKSRRTVEFGMKENPFPQWPRGLRRTLAAEYIGVSLPLFDKLVAEGSMPRPKRIHGRTIWDRVAVDRAFDLLDGGSPLDESGEQVIEFAP
jgi:predicted DNA-binding transcriptional regulator AlpA